MSKSLPFEVVMLKSLLAYVFYSCSCSSEVEAHDGNVNVIAFSTVNKQFFVITCGDDKIVKVWDVTSGDKCYTFDGQDAPHKKEQVNCRSTLLNFTRVQICHTYREGNSCADSLAKDALLKRSPMASFSRMAFLADYHGVSFFRNVPCNSLLS
ncbi:protein TOPLESS-like [Senna tora]|uniref:Protein TOPLESS-like n=1 Tax=Senna tora TaxID=362788 RepID=A0A834T7Q0_9FABA|nr:protein TOPLESS-like [Senna tora]